MGILSSLVSRMLKASPFSSVSLDSLAETMRVTDILKKNKLERYYRVGRLQACCISYSVKVFFDRKFLEMLSPIELRAVGAHEFTHIIKRHGVKRFWRIFVPSITIPAIVGFFIFVYYMSISHLPSYIYSEAGLFSLFVASL